MNLSNKGKDEGTLIGACSISPNTWYSFLLSFLIDLLCICYRVLSYEFDQSPTFRYIFDWFSLFCILHLLAFFIRFVQLDQICFNVCLLARHSCLFVCLSDHLPSFGHFNCTTSLRHFATIYPPVKLSVCLSVTSHVTVSNVYCS